MPRIKIFAANLGFYETAVAARSQKMALAHWGVTRDLFHEGTAKETNERKAVEAAMRKVGMVVRRPIGSAGPYEERDDAERTLLKILSRPRKPVKPAKMKAPIKKKKAVGKKR